ncbi:MAG: DUF922 domain-containing protein [Burkholderiales bacterium]
MKLIRLGLRAKFALVAGLALCWGVPAFAQIYKCALGASTVFSDQPCPDALSNPLKRTAPSGPKGQIDFQVGLRTYPVNGPNLAAAYLSMRANGPGGFAGFARWTVDYQYESKSTASGCAISSLKVNIKSDILMPNWIEEKSASTADQTAWRAMYTNLKRHEDGHVQHGREFGLLLKERLLGLGTQDCAQLQSLAQTEYQRLADNLRKRDEEYDRRTDHGLRQDNPR